MSILLLYPDWAGAIGAWFTDLSHRVVCRIGDGGFNMNPQEMQTFVVRLGVQS